MCPETTVLIRRSEVSSFWVTGESGGSSLLGEQDYSGLSIKQKVSGDNSFKSFTGKGEGARRKGEVKRKGLCYVCFKT